MPTASQMKNMLKRSEGRVKFTIKANETITHRIEDELTQNIVYNFKKAIEPLQQDDKLLCVLVQFPESFHYDIQERKYVDKVLQFFSNVPIVLEMRNAKWQNESVYNELRQRNVGWCITDNPQFKNSMKLAYTATSNISYMRFHGRNAKNWYTGDNRTRYDYLYSDEELETFIPDLAKLVELTTIVQLFFNNHAKSQAAINAKKLELLLKNYIFNGD
jgi:uncharacterized protein YecE (DUF72 family)